MAYNPTEKVNVLIIGGPADSKWILLDRTKEFACIDGIVYERRFLRWFQDHYVVFVDRLIKDEEIMKRLLLGYGNGAGRKLVKPDDVQPVGRRFNFDE